MNPGRIRGRWIVIVSQDRTAVDPLYIIKENIFCIKQSKDDHILPILTASWGNDKDNPPCGPNFFAPGSYASYRIVRFRVR